MRIGRKIYYEKLTGDVILITPEKFSGVQTTKEQDFMMYEVLSVRNPETVGVIELEFGQYSSDFQTANSVMVDLETGDLLFNYPIFEQPLSVMVNNLQLENNNLKHENSNLREEVQTLNQAILELSMLIGGM